MYILAFYFCLLICFLAPLRAQLVLNEIHCAAAAGTFSEFVEIYNPSTQSVSLAGWRLDKGVEFSFPNTASIAPNECIIVAKNPTATRSHFQLPPTVQVLGAYKGRLQSNDEKIELRNAADSLVDKVAYQLGFPYPLTSPNEKITSLQLQHFSLDNSQPAAWRGALPTPCAANTAVFVPDANIPPAISEVAHFPLAPKANEPVRITAKITDNEGVERAEVLYQTINAGAYIRLKDAAYENPNNWKTLILFDNGTNGDSLSNDQIYTAIIPNSEQIHRRLVRYRIAATDKTGKKVRVPYSDDTQPNFAYFVYNQLPNYAGYNFNNVQSVPVCHLLARAEDVDYGINRYNGDSYKNTGTVVYNNIVYDHVGFRSRGYRNRHARRKRNLKFNFNRGHKAEVLDNYGNLYPQKRDKWVLSGTWLLEKPNTHGLAELLTYRLFNLQNAPATTADFLHLRIIKSTQEQDTFAGDFYGLYLIMENFDKDFLDNHQLPNGNIYSYKPPKLRNQLPDTLLGLRNAPYLEWDTLCERRNTETWWRAHLDLPRYFAFVAAQDAINNRETGYRKQHWWMEYHNPKKNNWAVFPWDMDATWTSTNGQSSISGAIRKAAFYHQAIAIEYENYLRSFLDLLYNEEQMNMLIDEQAAFIFDSKKAYSFTDIDRLRWGQRYSSFATEISYFKKFVKTRAAVLLARLPRRIPNRPAIMYAGEQGFATDKLAFQSSAFVDDSSSFAAMEWRLAEVTDFNNPFYKPNQARAYEATAIWQSGEITHFNTKINLPAGVALPNRSYRVRVRYKNKEGRYSHWSEPIQFVAAPASETFVNKVIFSELMYHYHDTVKLEFIELRNISNQTIDLYQFEFKKGINFKFEDDYQLPPNGYVILTNDAALFKQVYGFSAQGEYKGNLNNEGETLIFSDALGNLVDSLTYSNNNEWDKNADGKGFSLEFIQNDAQNDLPSHWRASFSSGGTPAADFSKAEDGKKSSANLNLSDPLNSEANFINIYTISAATAAILISTLLYLRSRPPKA